MVHLFDFIPVVAEAYSLSLLAEVGELTARHFMLIDFRIRISFGFVDAFVVRTNRSPVAGHFFHSIDVEVRLTILAAQSVIQGAHARLAGTAGKGRISNVDDIDTGIDSPAVRRNGIARTIMGVEVNRKVNGIFQSRYQTVRSFRFQKTCHIFNGDDVGTGIFQFLSHVDVVCQIVFIPRRIEDIAGVAEGYFCQFIVFTNGLNRAVHII